MLKNKTLQKILKNGGSPVDKLEEIRKTMQEFDEHFKYLKSIARYIAEGVLVMYLLFHWIDTLFL
jgi:hypothetical protein